MPASHGRRASAPSGSRTAGRPDVPAFADVMETGIRQTAGEKVASLEARRGARGTSSQVSTKAGLAAAGARQVLQHFGGGARAAALPLVDLGRADRGGAGRVSRAARV